MLARLKDLEAEYARTQKNKATEGHLGMLKAKMARIRQQLMEGDSKSGGGKGEGFDVMKSGHARVAMIGFPSVGKSTMLSTLTNTKSEAAGYEFTTLTCIPGVIHYQGSKIQLLDLPGIIEGAAKGKGRGRQVIAVARTSDMVLMVLDASKSDVQRRLLLKELESVGIRINTKPPDVVLKKKAHGGVSYASTVPQPYVTEKMVKTVLNEFKVRNAEVLLRETITVDQFIDVVEGGRVYLRCLFVINKIDCLPLDEVDRFARQPHTVVVSCNWKLNLDGLLARMWKQLEVLRVYTKPQGQRPSFTEPLILRKGATIEDVCNQIHRDFAKRFKYALCWGKSVRHAGMRVGINHKLEDEDVVQLMAGAVKVKEDVKPSAKK